MTINEENWKNERLKDHYLYLHKYLNDYLFDFKFGSYFSSKKTIDVLKNNKDFDILEIGIGVGNFYRLLKINKILNSYTGADISQNYVTLANKIHKCDKFLLTDYQHRENLKDFYNVVYSRNVLQHQVNPYNFLNNLIKKTKNVLIVELRSRDEGATENDVKKSYQKVDDVLVPYIVLNYDELKNFLIKNDKCKNSRITINRDYQILGGKNSRHLPRELSEENTKTANTSIIIELGYNKNFKYQTNNAVKLIETFEKNTKKKKNIKHYLMIILNKLEIIYNLKIKKKNINTF